MNLLWLCSILKAPVVYGFSPISESISNWYLVYNNNNNNNNSDDDDDDDDDDGDGDDDDDDDDNEMLYKAHFLIIAQCVFYCGHNTIQYTIQYNTLQRNMIHNIRTHYFLENVDDIHDIS